MIYGLYKGTDLHYFNDYFTFTFLANGAPRTLSRANVLWIDGVKVTDTNCAILVNALVKGGAYKLVLNAYGQIEQINTATLYGGVVANVYTDVDSYIQYSWKHVATAEADGKIDTTKATNTIEYAKDANGKYIVVEDPNGNSAWKFAKAYYVYDSTLGCYKPVTCRTGNANENYFEMPGTGNLPVWVGIADANGNVTFEFDTAKVFNYATGAAAVAKSGDTFFFVVEDGEIVTLWTVPAGTSIPDPNFP